MNRIALLTLLLFANAACSSIRLKYQGETESPGAGGKPTQVTYEKSYDVGGGVPLLCGVTAIFFGGACWYYFVMPTVPQKAELRADAERATAAKLGQPQATLAPDYSVQHLSWGTGDDSLTLE